MLTQWHTLVAALWAAMGCGFAYTFSTFSLALKEQYQLAADDLETIGIATTAVGFITFSAGLITDCIGPTAALLMGGLANALGWFAYGAIAVWQLPIKAPVFVFTALGVLATYGASLVTGSVFSTLLKNFEPQEGRSTAIGIGKSWVGVASGFTTTVFVGFFPSADADPERLRYLFFLSCSVALFILVPLPLLRGARQQGTLVAGRSADMLCFPRAWRFKYLTLVTLLLIATVVFTAIAQRWASKDVKLTFSVLLVCIGVLPWFMLLEKPVVAARPAARPAELMPMADEPEVEPESVVGSSDQRPPSPWECGPLQMLFRPDSWLLWLCIFALQTAGNVLNTNMGLISLSRSGGPISLATGTALFSSAQSLGRLTAGSLSDQVVKRKFTRPHYFAVLQMSAALGYSMLFLRSTAAFYVGIAFIGYAFGSQYPVMIVVIAELFGTSRIASNYMVYDGMPGAFASLFVAKYFVNFVYQSNAHGAQDCQGDGCFQLTFLFVIAIQLFAGLCAVVLGLRSRPVYRESVWPVVGSPPKARGEVAGALAQS